MKRTLTLLAFVATMFSCMTQQYTVGAGAPTTAANKVDKRWDMHFVYGLVGKSRISVDCPNATVVTQQTAANSIVKGLTFGLVAPSTTVVYCAEAK